jgi:hypothetical protein
VATAAASVAGLFILGMLAATGVINALAAGAGR